MTTFERLKQVRARVLDIAGRHGVTEVRVFGSVAREEDRPDSDIDLLVVVGGQPSSWFPAGLVLDLEDLLGRRVEVVTDKALDGRLRDRVLREAIPL